MSSGEEQGSLPKVSTFRDLLAWQAAKQLALEVLRSCERPEMRRYYGLCDQLRRAAISVPSNIAEGNERGTNLDALRFLQVARGSLAELETQLVICAKVGLLSESDVRRIAEHSNRVGCQLGGLIRYRKSRPD